jgi:hypothetical protein
MDLGFFRHTEYTHFILNHVNCYSEVCDFVTANELTFGLVEMLVCICVSFVPRTSDCVYSLFVERVWKLWE